MSTVGRNLIKVQKALNEVYTGRSMPTSRHLSWLISSILRHHVSPDKRTIFMQSEQNLVDALKDVLEAAFSSRSSTFNVNGMQPVQKAQRTHTDRV
ncbi:hypothetical protein M378DRAFT_17902 [Amanita muscaria Koide BX008]|uniref:Uncharacterized protein n=1 Tax=Amanita muscaria (strain Koide BX008) TaxID=946122 RepID=A0A0C2RYT6_AMAMK|nr:hypothetical protein M378DRAFT_17902 [Amanita muscaria Koide BX008]